MQRCSGLSTTIEDLIAALRSYILWYNADRIKISLRARSPIEYPVEGPHFYTHALPRPHMQSRQTADAQRCVLELFKAVSQGSRPTVIREQPNASGAAH